MSTNNQINDRKKKFLLVLPLLVLPFTTMFFYALGGGQANAQDKAKQATGLNTQLPGAKLKNDSSENKLSFYQQAEKDSLKFKQARKDDPYYQDSGKIKKDTLSIYDSNLAPDSKGEIAQPSLPSHGLNSSRTTLSDNERRINEKLAALNKQISQPSAGVQTDGATTNAGNNSGSSALQQSMVKMKDQSNATDPEMQQLSGMLDKIMDIQNPALARQKLIEQSKKNRGEVFAVSSGKRENNITSLGNGYPDLSMAGQGQNGFYSFDNLTTGNDAQNAIEAVVHQTQTLTSGSTVKLRLVNDIFINGVMIPKGNFVFGVASLNGERLSVKISSIRYQKSLFPIDLSVYDMDGADGIYIPGAITRDVAKESADQSVQNLGFTSYDPSLGAQAASAGITAAKSLFSRKVRLVKVTVKAGYQVLLRDEKQKQSN